MIDLTGQRFGRLAAIKPTGERKGTAFVWQCLCDCGKEHFVNSNNLRTGHVKSCGCLRKEKITIHGMWKTPVYTTWKQMIQRCENPKSPTYKWYGGRGIKVCEQWHNFCDFFEDMGERPDGKTLDRWPDNDGNYEPGNCRWATPKEQQANSRTISYGPTRPRWFRAWHKDSMTQLISNNQCEFARQHGLYPQNITACLNGRQKHQKGWTFKRI